MRLILRSLTAAFALALSQPQPVQAPPDTEIYLAPMKIVDGAITIGPAENITNNPGYDNQPFFTPDGRAILFTSVRPSTVLGPGAAGQTDIYRYDIASKSISQVTNTSESEYSPTITPAGALSVVRVETDEAKTQRLWQFTLDGRDPRLVLEAVKPVGYHAWVDDHTLALFILGANGTPATLQLADTRTGSARVLASDIGRSIQRIPGTTGTAHISFTQRERVGDATVRTIKELDPTTGAIATLAPAIDGDPAELDTAWTPDGTLLAARRGVLYGWRRGDSRWKEIANLERLSLSGVTRLAISPKGDLLALVASPRATR